MNDALGSLQSFDAATALTSFVAYGVVMLCVVLGGISGLRLGLFQSIVGFGALVAATVSAFLWCEGAGRLIRGFGAPENWSLVIGYVTVLAITYALIRRLVRIATRSRRLVYPAIVDRLFGVCVGILGGFFLASVVRVGFAMTPVSTGVRPTPAQMQADLTPRVLQMMSQILYGDATLRRAWMFGAPVKSDDAAIVPGGMSSSEPFVDENGNGEFDRDEPYLDKDGNSRFTVRFGKVADEQSRELLVGVMERYWLGNW